MSLAAVVRQFGFEATRIRLIRHRHNTHWRVATNSGAYVLRKYGWGTGLPSAHWERHALVFAASMGLPVAVPIADPISHEGSIYALFPLLAGRKGNPRDDKGYFDDGRFLAVLHKTLADAPLSQRPGAVAVADPASALFAGRARRGHLLEPIRRKDGALADLLDEQADIVMDGLTALGAGSYPRTLVHGDLQSWNLLHIGDAITGILDFDAARLDARAADVANARRGYHDAVVDGYCADASLGAEELEALPLLWKSDILHNVFRYIVHFGDDCRLEDFNWAREQFPKTRPYRRQR
jgi:Ser/Thr protein kinase RdoA (MazF antagonist)